MNCSVHRDREARGVCSECGRAFCPGCLVQAEGISFCRPCRATRVFPVGKRRTRGQPARRTLRERIGGFLARLFGGA